MYMCVSVCRGGGGVRKDDTLLFSLFRAIKMFDDEIGIVLYFHLICILEFYN